MAVLITKAKLASIIFENIYICKEFPSFNVFAVVIFIYIKIDNSIYLFIPLPKILVMGRTITVKERILDTASRLFYYQGFNSTGINQIIAEAGVAIGSLYKHYSSKNDLLYQYLKQQDGLYFANLNDYLKEEKKPLQKLLKLVDYRIKIQKEADCSGCHFIKINAEIGRQDKQVAQLVMDHKQRQRDFINEIISEIATAQNLPMEKHSLANTIFLMIEGAIVSTSIHGNTNDLKAVKKAINQLF